MGEILDFHNEAVGVALKRLESEGLIVNIGPLEPGGPDRYVTRERYEQDLQNNKE